MGKFIIMILLIFNFRYCKYLVKITMAVNQASTYFNFTQYCSVCAVESKTFQIRLCIYCWCGRCKLTAEERKKFSFTCRICGQLNELDFEKICGKEALKALREETFDMSKEIAKKSHIKDNQ